MIHIRFEDVDEFLIAEALFFGFGIDRDQNRSVMELLVDDNSEASAFTRRDGGVSDSLFKQIVAQRDANIVFGLDLFDGVFKIGFEKFEFFAELFGFF
jgi:hypothetical protein